MIETPQVIVPVPNGTVPFTPELKVELARWMHRIEQMYLVTARKHVLENVPADIMARQMDRLSQLFHKAEAAYIVGNIGHLEQCYSDIKYFDEPIEAKAYIDQQHMQRDRRLSDKFDKGNR